MRPASGRQPCDCFDEHGHPEFKKIVELEDDGVAIYRYTPQTQYEAQFATETEEVFIFRNSGDDIKIEEFTGQSGKKGESCPRCRKMIERAKDLFKNLPAAKIRELTGVCNHCYQKHLKHCPCCDKIVDKFLKFCLETQQKSKEYREGQKSWVTQTELSFKRSVSNIRDGKERRTRLSDRSQEPQAPVSSYVPTIQPVQDTSFSEIYEKPRFKRKSELIHDQHLFKQAEKQLKVISFLDFPEEQNVVIEEKNEPLRKQKKNIVDGNLEQPLRSVSLIDFKSSPRLGKDKQFKSTIKRDIKPEQKIYEESKFTPMLEKYIEPKLTMEKEFKPESIIQTDTKPKSIMKKRGVKKARETGVPIDDTTPRGIKNRTDSSTTRHSFETIMKSLSEPNISVFSYTFPIDKIMPKKEMKRRVSSSELIKNTQDMLAEREEKAKKIKKERQEMITEREEQKKQRIAEKQRLSEEQKIKQEEVRVDIKSVELIDEELDEITAASKEGFAKRGKKITEEEKKMKRKEKYNAFGEEKVGKAGLQGDQDKEREKKRRDIEAHTALKEQVAKQSKEKSDEEKLKKQQEKEKALREKKAQEAEKSLQATQKESLKSEKTTDGRKEAIISANDLLQKDDKQLKESLVKTKERDEKQHDVVAQTALKEQVAKQAKEKAEEEKLRKQQEKDAELIAKKAQDAEKALEATQIQLISKTKKKLKSLSEAKPTDKSDSDKGGNLDNTAKEEKVKSGKNDDMAALLIEQLANQKRQELEKERLRKEQIKEKELAEKRLKELEAKKEATKSAIKAPLLQIEPEDSIDDNVSQVILKPDEVMDVIIGQKIYKVKSSKKIADETAIADSTQAQKLIHSESLPKQLLQAFSVQKPEEPMLMQNEPTSGDKTTKMVNNYKRKTSQAS